MQDRTNLTSFVRGKIREDVHIVMEKAPEVTVSMEHGSLACCLHSRESSYQKEEAILAAKSLILNALWSIVSQRITQIDQSSQSVHRVSIQNRTFPETKTSNPVAEDREDDVEVAKADASQSGVEIKV
jgi:hypothetical protein